MACRNFTIADNGAGPVTHVINGKEHGGGIEIAWVLDDRNRYQPVELTNMAGMQTAVPARSATAASLGGGGIVLD